MLRFRSLLVLAVALVPFAPGATTMIAGPARVVDGDTLRVGNTSIRLFGIDAPERGQGCDRAGQSWDCGAFAARLLADLVADTTVRCDVQVASDRYGRPVAICHSGARNLNAALVREGAAFAYRKYSDLYLGEELAAKAAARGIWAGRVVTPQVHRNADLSPQPADGCRIKGNISRSSGERIYHLPGQAQYGKTRISRPGEAWFCTEADARAAGFRPARA